MRIYIDTWIGGRVYSYLVKWPHAFLPSIGDTLNMEGILTRDQWFGACKTKFKGNRYYRGIDMSLADFFSWEEFVRVKSIKWKDEGLLIELTCDIFRLDAWEEIV